jgi:uncharacterized protein YydD (DUF2326 family)
LVHDSTIYDGVDYRQRAHALEFAYKMANICGFQYICALNSDMVSYEEVEEDFDINKFVHLTLGDERPEDSAPGFHLN